MSKILYALRENSHAVWNDKTFAEARHLPLNEETITERMLFYLQKILDRKSFLSRSHSKIKENKTGADWEWWFVSNGRGISMRIQAKRLYVSGRYEALSPKGAQIDSLIKDARRAAPFVVLYNFNTKNAPFQTAGHHCPSSSICKLAPEDWGCAIISANTLRRLGSSSSKILFPYTKPIHCLVCPHAAGTVTSPLPDRVASTLRKIDKNDSEFHDHAVPEFIMALLEQRAGSKNTKLEQGIKDYLDSKNLVGFNVFFE